MPIPRGGKILQVVQYGRGSESNCEEDAYKTKHIGKQNTLTYPALDVPSILLHAERCDEHIIDVPRPGFGLSRRSWGAHTTTAFIRPLIGIADR